MRVGNVLEQPSTVAELVGSRLQHLSFARRQNFVVIEAVPAATPFAKVGVVARVHRPFVHDHRE